MKIIHSEIIFSALVQAKLTKAFIDWSARGLKFLVPRKFQKSFSLQCFCCHRGEKKSPSAADFEMVQSGEKKEKEKRDLWISFLLSSSCSSFRLKVRAKQKRAGGALPLRQREQKQKQKQSHDQVWVRFRLLGESFGRASTPTPTPTRCTTTTSTLKLTTTTTLSVQHAALLLPYTLVNYSAD